MSVGGAIALAARIVLAGVLVIAAVSKLRHRSASHAATVAVLGEKAGPAIAALLPFVEIILAVQLLLVAGPGPGIMVALLVLGFTAVVLRANAKHVPCACFGGGADTPPGGGAIVRNGVLLALAILATGSP